MAIEFELASRRVPIILVKATVSGKSKSKTVTAIVDTGATGCVLTPEIAKELELVEIKAHKDDKTAHGVGGAIDVELVKSKEISIGKIRLTNVKTIVMPMANIHHQLKQSGVSVKKMPELIIGYTFFKNRKLEIDYKSKRMNIK